MFQKLQKKWKVSFLQVILILCVFTIGGSLTGIIADIIMPLFNVENKIIWIILYIILVTLIWPLMVIIISIPFGQFHFFKNYLIRIY
ncbi:MAG TPA: hypothetical protein PLH86_04740, partial [Saprospiraceae bacterium]|nr:hypothetical protein [Saprospiraceae bacterium]